MKKINQDGCGRRVLQAATSVARLTDEQRESLFSTLLDEAAAASEAAEVDPVDSGYPG
jgi:hypothetical protein